MKAEFLIVLSDGSLNIIEATGFVEARQVAQSLVVDSHVRIVAVRKIA